MLEVIAAFTATLFAGAALYINVAEHPARMLLDARSAVRQWAPSYQRATMLQAPLALVSFAAGVAVWMSGAGAGWLVAALAIGVVVPFTFIVVMPTNRKLLALVDAEATSDAVALLSRWNRLHAFRTVCSVMAALLYLYLLQQRA